jgi:hypothetical protein
MAGNRTGDTMRKRTMIATATALVALVAAGCGSKNAAPGTQAAPAKATTANPNAPEVSPAGDIPDNQAYVAYSPAGGVFSVKVPEGWAQTGSGAMTTFTDKLNSITVASSPAKSALTIQEAKKAGGTVDVVRRSAGPAVRSKFLANSKPDPVTGKVTKDAVERYVFFHSGQRIVLTLSGPKGADNVDPWKIVTDSVRWTR